MVGRMIGYVIGQKFGSWLLLRYGHYVGLTTGRIKLGQYLFMRYGGKIVFFAQFVPVLRTLGGPFAGANLMPWHDFMFANAVSSAVWAVSYGYAAYWLGAEFERLQGRMVVPLMLIAAIALIAGGLFVRQREAQLIAEAERAIPGSLELR
jgi:membrane protein DedA with SNARE-associated domain